MSNEQIIDELCGILSVDEPGEIVAAVRGLRDRAAQFAQPIVYLDAAGKLNVSQMTVRQTVQVITALEGLQVR
jgi:hypothetical protein